MLKDIARRIESKRAAKSLRRPLPCQDCGAPLDVDGYCAKCPPPRDEYDPIDDRSDIR